MAVRHHTVYHFLFVPITIGLSAIVAGYETAWLRTGNEHWLRLTKFFGKLFLINFAIGVVTGIVQEFQFGMNWSDYSRFVGDVFGAPLAIEGLLAFFLESTFLGLWIFGWDRLPAEAARRLHLAGAPRHAVLGVLHPRRQLVDAEPGRLRLQPRHRPGRDERLRRGAAQQGAARDLPARRPVGVPDRRRVRRRASPSGSWPAPRPDARTAAMYRAAVRTGAAVVLVAGLGVAITGDFQGKIMTEVQPMKMAAAEALYETEAPAAFSLLTIGTLDGSEETFSIKIPGLLSFLATGTTDGEVRASTTCASSTSETYGKDPGAAYYSPGDYTPIIPLTYWTFRLMIGPRPRGGRVAGWILWATRRGRPPAGRRRSSAAAMLLPFLPLLANSFGWIFTEVGPSALGRVRADDDRARRSPPASARRGADLADRAHARCTACWPSSRCG